MYDTKNLESIFLQFPSQEHCIRFIETLRWRNGPICPYCDSKKQTPLPKELRYHCNNCRSSFSITTNTLFHKTKIELQKWFLAIHLVINERVGVRQLGRTIKVTKDTAAYMTDRIKIAYLNQPDFINQFIK